MKIIYSSKFKRAYKKLTKDLKSSAKKKEKIFRKNPFQSSLNTHKLDGRLGEFWSFSISYSHRIIFEFASKDVVYFHSVGSHDVYK